MIKKSTGGDRRDGGGGQLAVVAGEKKARRDGKKTRTIRGRGGSRTFRGPAQGKDKEEGKAKIGSPQPGVDAGARERMDRQGQRMYSNFR